MFYYLNGTITVLDTGLAVVDCGGVGYACHTTNYTLSKLQVGKQAKLFTYCNIKEDAFDIYGFSTREELNCFERLLGVGGVGPKAALAILSVVTPDQFLLAVMMQDEKTLTMAQGVGKKMAQRILLELKDKLAPAQLELSGAQMESAVPVRGSKTAEATAKATKAAAQTSAKAARTTAQAAKTAAQTLVAAAKAAAPRCSWARSGLPRGTGCGCARPVPG